MDTKAVDPMILSPEKETSGKHAVDTRVAPLSDRKDGDVTSILAEDKFEVFKVNISAHETNYRTVGWYFVSARPTNS